MTLKDWKKVGNDEWRANEKVVLIMKYPRDKFIVRVGLVDGFYHNIAQELKTKSQALKFAKSYMRTH